ncbi:MAG TPA: hypothetical protein VFY89_10530 [Ktedonobacterales bacterium]
MWEQHGQNRQPLPINRINRTGGSDQASARPPTPDAAAPAPGDSPAKTAMPPLPQEAGGPAPFPPIGARAGESGPAESAISAPAASQDAVWWQRVRTRQLIREFLRSVPRSEEQTTLPIVHPDGRVRLITRGQMSAAIDQMRPRMRQVVRLTLEEGWSRQRVCAYLHNFSMRTLERDQVEGLDLLANL